MAARTIRTNLLWVVFAALLPLSGVAVWQAYVGLQDSRTLVATRLRANASAIAERERDPFIIARNSLIIAAEQPDVRQIGSRCSEILAGALKGAYGLLNFLRTDADGRARCSVLPFTPGQDLSKNRWWLDRRGREGLYLAEPEIGAISKRPVLIMVLPLYSSAGRFQGTLSAGVSIEQLQASLQRKKPDVPGVVLLADGSGTPIITNQAKRFGVLDEVIDAQSFPHMTVAKDGSEWTYVTAPLFRNDLHIVYAEPEKLVTRTALSRMWLSLLLPLLALVLASIAIWFATQRLILRWLNQLQMLTARFARGDFTGELAKYDNAPAELSEFAADLHNMAGAIDTQERELREALATKIALTKEVNHRVKNNLQIINSLLTLQSERLTDPVVRLALGQARSRIAALGLIHRLLYEGDGGDEQGSVNMRRLLNDLSAQLRNGFRARAGITLECHASDTFLTADQAVPVTLFTVEAVTNAFQHAFVAGRKGSIILHFEVDGGTAEMRVSDDGQGFVQAATTNNMGIDLIQAFGQQVDGKVEINSLPSGTELTLRFAVSS
jgi:two-component sensor histidine kinase